MTPSAQSPLRLAVGQALSDEDPVVVVERAVLLVELAAASGARVLLLSELHLFGYDVDRYVGSGAAIRVDDAGDDRIAPLRAACARTGVDLFVGAAVDEDGERWNAVLHIDATGAVSVAHRKVHVWATEGVAFSRGRSGSVVEVDGWRIGLGICYDAGFPEYTRALVRAGADVVLFSSAFARGDEERRYDVYHVARALESGVWLGVANALGTFGGADFFGRGVVVDPYGHRVVELGDEPGIVTVDLDRDRMRDARASLPYLTDLLDEYPVR